MVGRFIDKKKTVFLGEQSGQQNFSPLAQGKSDIGPAIGFLFDFQLGKLPQKNPIRTIRTNAQGRLQGGLAGILNREGK